MSTLTKTAALGALAALVATTAAVGTADAHSRKHRLNFIVAPHDDCGYYKWKWFKTGKLFWKLKYYECKSWY